MTSLPNLERETVDADATRGDDAPGPWRRFLARGIDEWAVGVVLSVLIPSSFTVRYVRENGTVGMWLFSYSSFWLLSIVIEAILLASFGTTLGKRLLGVRVEQPDGQPPSFSEALQRTVRCWVFGMGLGFPLFFFFTGALSYHQLRRDGITPWDRATGLVVRRRSSEPSAATSQ